MANDDGMRMCICIRHEPPGNGGGLHGLEDEAGGEGWGVVLHHLVMKAADGLDGAHGKVVFAVGVAEVEVVGAPGLRVTVVVTIKAEGEESIGLVVHEVAAHHVGAVVGEAARVLVGGGLQEERGGVDGSTADGDDVAEVGGEFGKIVNGTVVLNFDANNGGSCWICDYFSYFCFGEKRDIRKMHDLADAIDVGVGFGVNEAWIAVAGVAADAFGIENVG